MFKKLVLKNGVRVVCERIPYLKSVSIGIWVRTGSRNENLKNNGVSHFIEHMLFKGTEKRTAAEIAGSIDNIGGQLNAFTGKECTCFYTKTLDEHTEIAVEVLSDMFFNSVYAKRAIALEKKVILEEIGMYEDTPEELVHDILSEAVWEGSTIGYPILGTNKSLRGINREAILDYLKERYTTGNTVISVAGNFDETELLELLEKYFGTWSENSAEPAAKQNVEFKPGICVRVKDTEQVHMCIGYEGIEHGDDQIYPLLAVNNIIGGGMSSRLFQKIREKRGLAYSIYSYPTSYKDAGLFTVYAGMKPEHLHEVNALIQEEIQLLLKKGITGTELEMTKEQLKGNFILGLESTSSRMNSNGKSELMLGYTNTPEEIIQKIEAIKMDDVRDIIFKIFKDRMAGISIVGNLSEDFNPDSML